MFRNKKILAIIPARGGSKGIKGKNLKKIKNKSLIQIAANILNGLKYIDFSIISSDDEKIIKEAKKYKINFLEKRPKSLSGDRIGDAPVLKNALKTAEDKIGVKFDIILMIQVTSPLRTKLDILKSIKLMVNKKLDAVWSISKVDKKFHPFKQLKINKNILSYHNNKGSKILARQQLSETYIRNGAVYVFSRNSILKMNLMPKKTGFIISNTKQLSIDSLEDLEAVRKILI